MACSSTTELLHFQAIHLRLDRSNYAFWRMQVLTTVHVHGFSEFISDRSVPPQQFLPSSSVGPRTLNPDYQVWICLDQYLMSWMFSSISESMLGYGTRCVTVCDLWRVLESLFQSQSKARVMQLRLQLQTTRKGDLSVDEYFLKMKGFADLLAGAGQQTSDDDLILYILAGFGPEYDTVVVNLTHRSDSLNLQEVHANVAYQRAPYSGSHSRFQNYDSYSNNGGRSYQMFRGRGGGRGFSRESKIVCQLCGKSGHVALKCYKRFDVNFIGNAPCQPQAYYTDFYGYDPSQEEGYYDEDPSAQWFVDSGATNHVTNDLNNLSVRKTYTGDEHLLVGNDNQLSIDSVGQTKSQGGDEKGRWQRGFINLICQDLI